MKRWILILLWFAVQFAWNLATKNTLSPDGTFLHRCLTALSYMTSPVQILTSIVAVVVIWKRIWKRKPLAER